MLLLLVNMFAVRLLGAYIVARVLNLGLVATWMVLSSELMLRGILMFGRFVHGGWKKINV
jgi:Na+-driven multidrug efflux pump